MPCLTIVHRSFSVANVCIDKLQTFKILFNRELHKVLASLFPLPLTVNKTVFEVLERES